MGDEYNEGLGPNPNPKSGPLKQEELDKRLEEVKRRIVHGANEAQVRIKRVVDKAGDYWQQTQTAPVPRQATTVEEQRLRQLVNTWSSENWRVAKDLGTYMDIVFWSMDEVWEVTLQTRWETRNMEIVTEPYTGRMVSAPKPLLPIWDYQLPPIVGLKAPQTRTRLEGMDEIVACAGCNSTGHVLCATCTGRGWVVCPECKGRTKKRCTTCKGRAYVADWVSGEKKAFFQKQAENVANSVGGKVSDVLDGIRQQGVPIPNPVDTDPASKGPTVPCPDCIKGEVPCTCGNGKRVCSACEGARMSFCTPCSGTGKVVRHREIARRFDLRTQTRIVGESPIAVQQLLKADGDLIYNAEINETLHPEAPPDGVPIDVWRTAVDLVRVEVEVADKPGIDPQTVSRPTLQVIELVHIPYIKLQYRYGDEEYVLYIYDGEGKEKFYADHYPARWDRIERLVEAISQDLTAPVQREEAPPSNAAGGYRVPIEMPPYNITEEDEEDHPGNS